MSPDFEQLVGRAILDTSFRKQLLDDPDGTVKGAGFTITAAEMDQIREAAQNREATDQALNAVNRGFWS